MRVLPLAMLLAVTRTARADPGDRWDAGTMGWQAVGVGGLTGAIIGVDYAGDHRHSTGRWYGTTIGIVAGVFVTGAMKLVSDRLDLRLPRGADALLGAIFIVGGAVVGYQLTASPHPLVAMRLAAFAF